LLGELDLTKKTLIKAIGQSTKQTVRASDRAAEAVLEAISQGLLADGMFMLPGIGTLKVVERAARKGRDPRTGEAIQIPPKSFIKFSAAQGLSGAINDRRHGPRVIGRE
jgi:DNA-binding protein HU-beta